MLDVSVYPSSFKNTYWVMLYLFFKHPKDFLLLLEILHGLASLFFPSYFVSSWFSHVVFFLYPHIWYALTYTFAGVVPFTEEALSSHFDFR